MKLFLIDAIGPFFRGYERKKINWSKIPFTHLPTAGPARDTQFAQIREDLDVFAGRVKALGVNAVTLDDVVHLTDHPFYEAPVREQIAVYSAEFRRIFDLLADHGLQIYLTMDVYSSTPGLQKRLGNDKRRINAFLQDLVARCLDQYPQLAGIIFRVGESDGLDVKGLFRSQLYIKTPAMLNRFIHDMLPLFESRGRTLILRTWTVGAHSVGDLIWHRDTLASALEGIDSEAFILSMKHGESDFFRYLPVNKNFFRTPVQKIVELQSKREYEGCGEFPAFIGLEHEHIARELAGAPGMVGMCIWCQTGGWVPFRRLAFIGQGSLWTEINTAVTLALFRDGLSLEEAVCRVAEERPASAMLEFLRLSEEVVCELYYHKEFAEQKLFFRRVRVPPLIGVYWNTIFVNHSLKKLLRYYTSEPEAELSAASAALEKIRRMEVLAERLDLPVADVVFMRHTFAILALARSYFYQPYDESIRERLRKAKKQYKKTYPKTLRPRYAVRLDFTPFRLRGRFLRWSLALLLRRRRGYRLIDQIFTIHLLSYLFRLISRASPRVVPKFARKSAMGVETLFR
ncbi:hypothetical protein Q4485_01760 [Granulosicoccaceae sp. 1_MG-2023]|nr:hypothetical protein [Granulosicoccaceae sp. 1_MG-2023]